MPLLNDANIPKRLRVAKIINAIFLVMINPGICASVISTFPINCEISIIVIAKLVIWPTILIVASVAEATP